MVGAPAEFIVLSASADDAFEMDYKNKLPLLGLGLTE
jgi:hypothetical protein